MMTTSSRQGFTLIETLVAISISIVVSGVIAQSFVGGWRAQLSQEIYSELQRSARFTVDEVSKQVWSATTVVSSTTVDSTTYQSDADTLVLRLPPLDNTGTIINGDDFVIFDLSSGVTERIISPLALSTRAAIVTPLTLNRDTGALVFRYYNAAGSELLPGANDLSAARSINVSVNATRVSSNQTFTRNVESRVILRNKGI